MFEQAAIVNYFYCKVRQSLERDLLALCFVVDDAFVVVDLDVVAIVDKLRSVGQFDNVEAAVDAVAVEDASKGLGNDGADLCALDSPEQRQCRLVNIWR